MTTTSKKKAQTAQVTTKKERPAGETFQAVQAAQAQSAPSDGFRKLDRSRPFGRIEPPWPGPKGKEFRRLAFYEQDGAFYDLESRLLIPGERAPKPAADQSGELW